MSSLSRLHGNQSRGLGIHRDGAAQAFDAQMTFAVILLESHESRGKGHDRLYDFIFA